MEENIVKRFPSPWFHYRDAVQFLQDLTRILLLIDGSNGFYWFGSEHSSLKEVNFFKDYEDPIP